MSRRPVNPNARRFAESSVTPSISPLHQKSRSSPFLSIGLVLLGGFLLLGYSYSGSGTGKETSKEDISRKVLGLENGDVLSCDLEVLRALPLLQEVYGDSMRKILHVGLDTCSVISKLLKEDDIEAWGIEPFDSVTSPDAYCKQLISKGFVRAADIKFPLPYRARSFSAVLVSDAPDYLSPKYLNKTLPDLARVSADALILFVGTPSHQSSKMINSVQQSKVGRPAKFRAQGWWQKFFETAGLQENDSKAKKFQEIQTQKSYKPTCQIFHLSPDTTPLRMD
eukprot:TRINITY_DN28857_c0_g1_i1.p1 TRINITY_DN28857_c0_g1~~TRINITY_DN28857_c0_g1_i1.p1  ORF type:complete len:281 (+),score=62.87 TRINITY_DN28857_c0_g1_i1:223-1065(+)